MKRSLSALGVIAAVGLVSTLAWVGVSHAGNLKSGDAPSVGKDEVIDGTVYIAGRTVTVEGVIKGDLFCAGMDVVVNAVVEGDVICAGQTLRINGTVQGDVRAAAQQLDFSAKVSGSASLAGESLNITDETNIGRDLTVAAQTIRLKGQVGRDVHGGGGDAVIDGKVGRNVLIDIENLALGRSAAVGGDLTYHGPSQVLKDGEAVVTGKTNYVESQAREHNENAASRINSTLFGLGSMALIGLAAILIAPRWFDTTGSAARKRPMASFVAGAAILFGVPVLAVLMAVTMVGLPLALIVICLWLAAMLSAMVVSAYAVGWLVIERVNRPLRGRRVASLLTGLLLFAVVGLIPVVGGIMIFVSLVFGLGALGVALFGRLRPATTKPAKGAKA